MISDTSAAPDPEHRANTWWRNGMVWMVISGPAVVVVAAIATAVIAYRGADTVLVETPSARHAVTTPGADTPAMQARNHAATAAPR
ncbi:hypothetical protein [Ideonella sp. A 288]|uniref:hypothetical protein n=1 Tax=Ideonella sp. A 288 TaxID=1962181 RepID=UPI001F361F97|nr:hypothetical protein [Ideonella sp. A 288]